MFLDLSLFLFFFTIATNAAVTGGIQTKSGCQTKCGNVNIPYPFGIGTNCSIDDWANITCNTTFDPPKPFIHSGFEVVQISQTEVRIKNIISSICFSQSGALIQREIARVNLSGTPFTFSSTKNKITAIGCDNLLYVFLNSNNYGTQCTTFCFQKEDVVLDSCSGMGCCDMPIPKGLKAFAASIVAFDNHTAVWSFDPCGAAFLGEAGTDNFKISDFSNLTSVRQIPIVLNFAVGNETCGDARKNSATFACKSNHSFCYDSVDGTGYLCSCNIGYQGNPYIEDSCQDVNECQDPVHNPCDGNCVNTEGSYYCSCPKDSYGDGRKDGTHCTERIKPFPIIRVTLGLGIGFLFLVVGFSGFYLSAKKRKLSRLKKKFFEQNGGLLLEQQISSQGGGGGELTKIFTSEELKLATNDYEESRILGQGGNGTVYKGILADKRTVAIKRSKVVDESQLGQFINEVVILTRINHRNVVKLLGCCLETEVPILVYEFVSNGTLYDHLHKNDFTISWEERLRIASQSAGALAYLHSAASIPIIHRDVKSANILLDDHYTAKVADFGASRLNPLDQTQISTLVQGTMGYLDPEYFHNSQLTEKSDVYSFGVVLAEILTGKKPLCFERSEERRHLAIYFTGSGRENELFQLIEAGIEGEREKEQVHLAAVIAKRCLSLSGEERPSMREVAAELDDMGGFDRHSWMEESIALPSQDRDLYPITDGSSLPYRVTSPLISNYSSTSF